MSHDKIFRLRKYLFFISILVFLPLSLHLVYTYFYSDSKITIVEGGNVSEAIIGNPPTLNPLKPLSGDNKYIVNLLYRSLLKYDVSEKKIISDIATCDLTNLLLVKCDVKDDIFWSNGEKLTIKDVLANYKLYKNSDINPIMSTLLSNTEITQDNNSILFSSTEAHIKFLDVFFIPIAPESLINSISLDDSKSNFFSSGGIYSGKYKFGFISKDDPDGIPKLTLIKNKNYVSNNVNIENLIISFFPTYQEFLKYKDSVNLFSDDNGLSEGTFSRLENKPFYLPQYVSLFINKDNIDNVSLRTYIFNKINRENLLKIIGSKNFKKLKNTYLTDEVIDNNTDSKNLMEILSSLGYYKRGDFLFKANSDFNKYSSGNQLITGSISLNPIKLVDDKVYSIDKFQKKSSIIIDPSFIDKYNFITKDNILLKGKAGKDVTEVYVNNYKLNGFTSGNEFFYYRIKETVGNIKQGINKYKIEFTRNGKKELIEEIYFLYYKNSSELEKQKDIFIKGLYGVTEQQSLEIQESTEQLKQENIKTQNEKLKKESEEKLNKIKSLDDKYFYNNNLEKFSLNLIYVDSGKDTELTANYIKNSLSQDGIDVNLKSITIEQLADIISKEDDLKNDVYNYDMILVAINLGNFDFDIYSYFHSSKVSHKPRSNFSKIKKSDLDSLLEELEGKYLSKNQIYEVEKKVLEILKQEQVVKVLYTPLVTNLVDKSIKNYKNIDYIPDKSFRSQLMEDIYIMEKKEPNWNNKGVIGFIKFLFKSLNE